jgi:hypothetical protein
MHSTLTQTYKMSTVKSQKDRALPYLRVTSGRPEVGGDRIIVLNQESKSWSSPTTALALVIIALATLVAGAMTTWHYWNVEKRAAQGEHQAAMQRRMEWWKGEIQMAESKRQQYKQPEEAQPKTASYAYGAKVRTAAATELEMLSGPSTAAFRVP